MKSWNELHGAKHLVQMYFSVHVLAPSVEKCSSQAERPLHVTEFLCSTVCSTCDLEEVARGKME